MVALAIALFMYVLFGFAISRLFTVCGTPYCKDVNGFLLLFLWPFFLVPIAMNKDLTDQDVKYDD